MMHSGRGRRNRGHSLRANSSFYYGNNGVCLSSTLLSLLLLLPLQLFLWSPATVIRGVEAASHSYTSNTPSTVPLTKNQEKVHAAWNQLVSDFDGFKSIFAEDAKIKMCLKGMPFCTEGTFPEMLEGFRVAFSSFQVKHRFLTGSSHPDTFLVEWVNSIETNTNTNPNYNAINSNKQTNQKQHGKQKKDINNNANSSGGSGCKAMWWGYATYEFNDQGKVKRFVGMSEESEDVINCVSKVSGINAEL